MRRSSLVCAGIAAVALGGFSPCFAQEHRIVVEVAPADIGERKMDQRPARVDLDFDALFTHARVKGEVEFDSIRVVPDDSSHKPAGKSLPFRWYDADVPEMFPEFVGSVVRSDGKIVRKPMKMAGYFWNTAGRGKKGFLSFIHTQTGNAPATYTITFNVLAPGTPSKGNGPRGWIGDGQARCAEVSSSTTATGHTRIDLDDWNEDGLLDIVQGEENGFLFLYPNVGTKQEPKFTHRMFISDNEGPIDIGTHCAPVVMDFDGDGVKDVIAGTYTNRIVFFKNTGTNKDRKLEFKGVVMADGKPIELPHRPIVGRPEAGFSHDYYPNMDAVDWNGDGKIDLLAGGGVTGRIYLLENKGANPDGTPILAQPVPLEADGKIINVGDWSATAEVGDLNGDGKPDILSGNQPMTKEASESGVFLRYYQGGDSGLTEKPLPLTGKLPFGGLATPRLGDLNGDGLPDLVVSVRQSIYVFFNRGQAGAPKFETHSKPILLPWESSPLGFPQFVDFNRDGKPDLFNKYVVSLNSGEPSPFKFEKDVNVLGKAQHIAHPSGIGDDWFWPYLSDFDGDGDFDVLFGDWHGTVWFHRNSGSDASPNYDMEGYRLKMTDGNEIKVGPIGKDISTDFSALQGARTVFDAADLDSDGLNDLVVGDTYGVVRYYRNAGSAAEPVFQLPVPVGDVTTRCSVDVADWDGDGKPDIIAGAANGTVRVYLNSSKDGKIGFSEGIDPKLPPLKQPRVMMVDLNGDGDEDLYVPSLQGSVWIERSFLKHGYAKTRIVRFDAAKP